MFLLWKSPGGSKRYSSTSHRSRRNPGAREHCYTPHAITEHPASLSPRVRVCVCVCHLLHLYGRCTLHLCRSSSPAPPQSQKTHPAARLGIHLQHTHTISDKRYWAIMSSPVFVLLSVSLSFAFLPFLVSACLVSVAHSLGITLILACSHGLSVFLSFLPRTPHTLSFFFFCTAHSLSVQHVPLARYTFSLSHTCAHLTHLSAKAIPETSDLTPRAKSNFRQQTKWILGVHFIRSRRN